MSAAYAYVGRPIAQRNLRNNREEIHMHVSVILEKLDEGERLTDLIREYGLDIPGWGRWYKAYLAYEIEQYRDQIARVNRAVRRGHPLRYALRREGLSRDKWKTLAAAYAAASRSKEFGLVAKEINAYRAALKRVSRALNKGVTLDDALNYEGLSKEKWAVFYPAFVAASKTFEYT